MKKTSEAMSTGVCIVGAASLQRHWANTDGFHAVIKFFKEGMGENFLQKIVSQWYAKLRRSRAEISSKLIVVLHMRRKNERNESNKFLKGTLWHT